MNTNVLEIWIVDDEPAMCLGVTRALEEYRAVFDDLDETVEYRVSTMESGEEFLKRLDLDTPPQLLLLDGKLPGVDGIEVLRLLAERHLEIVTVMITAYATLENAVKATRLGAFDFLAKPFTPAELRHAVSRATRDLLLTRRTRRLEQEKRQVRFEFLSVLAHELKSPLAALEGFIDMLRQGSADPAVLERMERRTLGMRKLIADLLDLTAIESGRRKRNLQSLEVGEVVRSVVDTHRVPAQARAVSLSVEAGTPCLMKADRTELEMLLNNLVSNAIKYNRPDGTATVTVSHTADAVRIDVADTGIGIAPEDQARLFAEFSRIKNRQTGTIEGSGLGLSIVRRIATLYGGTVVLTSAASKGSTFTVLLPRPEPESD